MQWTWSRVCLLKRTLDRTQDKERLREKIREDDSQVLWVKFKLYFI